MTGERDGLGRRFRPGLTRAVISLVVVSTNVIGAVVVVALTLLVIPFPEGRDIPPVNYIVAAAVYVAVAVPIAFLPAWPIPLLQVLVAGSALFVAYAVAMKGFGLTGEDRALLSLGRARLTRRVNFGRP